MSSTNPRIEQMMAAQNEAIEKYKLKQVEYMLKVHNESLEIFTRKNIDYGDAFAIYGPIGVLIRIGDKIQRLTNITNNGITLVNDETLKDTLLDLHNYAAMAIMLLNEKSG
jgi:hypothetical protein